MPVKRVTKNWVRPLASLQLRILIISLFFIFAGQAAAVDIIVDNDDGNILFKEEFGFYLDEPGRWTRDASTGWGGSHYVSNHDEPDDARWYPMLPSSGDYLVYVWYVANSSRDNEAEYTIEYNGGSSDTSIDVDQRINGGQWNYIGTFHFNGTDDEYVELNLDDEDKTVSADAVRFVSVGASTTTTTTTTTTTSSTTTTTFVAGTTTTTTIPCPSLAISDVPLDAMLQPAPANIMFLLDDSGSMDWEVITNESNGLFNNYYYIFDDPGDNLYNASDILPASERRFFKSQWSGYNKIYYNPDPTVDYSPWPTFSDAGMTTPRSHPNHATPTFNLDAVYGNISGVNILNAHYYTWDDVNGDDIKDSTEDYYLVNLTNPITYYRFNDANSDDSVDAAELIFVAAGSVPGSVITYWPPVDGSAYNLERQRFANWYSYYRRRELIAIGSMARVVDTMRGVKIGIKGINNVFAVHPPRPIRIGTTDESSILLNALYNYVGQAQGTPLRLGLEDVGEFFDQTDASDGGISATSPFALEADGGACQQCFTIVITDGYYNGSDPSVGNADGDNGAPYQDGYSETLADVAMYYYENDLHSTLPDEVPVNMYDSATHQHMVTYSVSFGVYGTLNPASFDLASGPYPTWPNPTSGNPEKIDDLWHASVNGHGLFFSADNSQELVDATLNILESIEARTASSAAVTIDSNSSYADISNNVVMFQTRYYSGSWGGEIRATSIDTVNGSVITEPIVWSAHDRLDYFLENSGFANRIIATYDGTNGQPFSYSNFSNLSTNQKTILSSGSVTAEQMMNYLRGDDTLEQENGGTLRTRFFPYGDIVHSAAVYYDGILYAGANDGMLHALDATTGNELFSYIPVLAFDNITSLSDPAYSHKYFVDKSPYIKKMGSTVYLVGGLGKGGKGYYCLDVTNPYLINSESVLANRVKWEFPAAYDADMGYSFSNAYLIKTYDATLNAGTDLEGYVVIFGNGYQSANGNAVFYVVNPANGALIKKIDTGYGSGCNGLSTPKMIDVDNDSKVDYVYAGDLYGNMWKFDLTDTSSANWDVAYKDGATPKPVFQAKDNRPITTRPDVMYQCPNNDGYLVIFGTGKYLDSTDLSNTDVQSVYGIWDYGDDNDNTEYLGTYVPAATPPLSNQPAEVTLLQQTATFENTVTTNAAGYTIDSKYIRVLSNNSINRWVTPDSTAGENPNITGYSAIGADGFDNDLDGLTNEADEQSATASHAGWYFDLPLNADGERIIVDIRIRDWRAWVISSVPQALPCSGGGYSIVHQMDACTGGRTADPVWEISGDYKIDSADQVGSGEAVTGIRYDGLVWLPLFLRDGNSGIEHSYLSTSGAGIDGGQGTASQMGQYYWLEQ